MACATAHPIEGLCKYHGMTDPVLRIPYHDSISVCTAPLHTTTRVELVPGADRDRFIVSERELLGRAADRVHAVVDAVRDLASDRTPCVVRSHNSFASNVGLGASASAFASIAAATAAAYGVRTDLAGLSRLARLGSGSAARAAVGGFARWRAGTDHHTSYAYRIAVPSLAEQEARIIAVPVARPKSTEDAHREAVESPFFHARVERANAVADEMEAALLAGDIAAVFAAAERDTLSLHAVTMTGPSGMVLWNDATLRVMHVVRDLRRAGALAWFSVDTGATAYVNTFRDQLVPVGAALAELGMSWIECTVGPGVSVTDI